MNPTVLAEQTHAFVRGQQWHVAVLPFGATEPHNLHMPYGTDNFQVEELARRSCQFAYDQGAKALCLPTVPFGVNTSQLRIPGAVTLSVTPSTLMKLTADLVESLEQQGLRKLVLLNGHGGNELKPILRELHHRSSMFICLCDWFKMGADAARQIFDKPSEHADEMETSLGLEFFPELMKMEQAGPGTAKPTRFEAINNGWIGIVRPWHLMTEDTGVGDPRAATAEKGRRLMDVLVSRLGQFLVELARSPMDERFPY